MAIALRGSAGNNVASGSIGSPATVTYPAGVVAGDVVLLFVGSHLNGNIAFTTPTGFTPIPNFPDTNTGTAAFSDCQAIGYYRVATGSLSGSVSITLDGSNWVTMMIVFSGCDTINPFIAENVATSTTSSSTITTASVTNTDTEAALVTCFFGVTSGTTDRTWTATTTNSTTLNAAANTERNTDRSSTNIFCETHYGLNAGATSTTCTGTISASATSTDKIAWLGFIRPPQPSDLIWKQHQTTQANVRARYW